MKTSKSKLPDLLLIFALFSIASAVRPGCVVLYEHCNYRGKFFN